MAFHNYHATFESFPPGIDDNGFGWGAYLVPFMEEPKLHAQLDFSKPLATGDVSVSGGESSDNSAVASEPLQLFRCPGNENSLNESPTYLTNGSLVSVPPTMITNQATSNYVGNFGVADFGTNSPDGVLFLNSGIRIRDIADGTANTALVGERRIEGLAPDQYAYWAGSPNGQLSNVLSNGQHAINNLNAPAGFSSIHEGGCHILLCDGAVVFLPVELADSNPKITSGPGMGNFQKLLNRNDGQTLDENF